MNIKELQFSQAVFDTNIVVYYCSHFLVTMRGESIDLCLIETEKAHQLTKELIESDKTIITLKLNLDEIENKGIPEFIDDFCDNPEIKKKLGVKIVPDKVRLLFVQKMERKLTKLQNNVWFDVTGYTPSPESISILRRFFISLDGTTKMMEHLHRKRHYDAVPSYEDLALLCCSSEFDLLLVSNDTDITDFIPELKGAGHCFEIFDLKEYNV